MKQESIDKKDDQVKIPITVSMKDTSQFQSSLKNEDLLNAAEEIPHRDSYQVKNIDS